MMAEHREYERADGKGDRPSKRVRLPGDRKHEIRHETAKEIAVKISLAKIDKQIKALKDG